MRKNRRDLCHAGFTKNFIYFLMGHRIRGSALFAVRPGLTKKAKRPIMLYVKRIDGESMPANLAQRGRPSAVSRPESLLAEVRS